VLTNFDILATAGAEYKAVCEGTRRRLTIEATVKL
jgi:hypothetical protein